MPHSWRAYRQRWVRKWFPMDLPAEPEVPLSFAGPIIDAWSRTGNIGRMIRDAVKSANRDGRKEDAQLYRAMGDQLSDWYGQMR